MQNTSRRRRSKILHPIVARMEKPCRHLQLGWEARSIDMDIAIVHTLYLRTCLSSCSTGVSVCSFCPPCPPIGRCVSFSEGTRRVARINVECTRDFEAASSYFRYCRASLPLSLFVPLHVGASPWYSISRARFLRGDKSGTIPVGRRLISEDVIIRR